MIDVLSHSAWQEQLAAIAVRLDKLEGRLAVHGGQQPKFIPSQRLGALATVRAARRLNRASGPLALSVMADSAIEHYRGSFENKAMFTPLVVSALALGVSAHGTADRRAGAHRMRDGVYAVAALAGGAGSGFHVYNVLKRPGGLSWQNLFYGAPFGAPAAIFLSGLLGVYSERLRNASGGSSQRVLGLPAGRALAALAGAACSARRRKPGSCISAAPITTPLCSHLSPFHRSASL